MKFMIPTKKSVPPYVIALDVGSSGSRGGIYDGTGRPLKEWRLKVTHAFASAPDGTSTIDPDAVTAELAHILDRLVTNQWRGKIAAVAIDTFASSLVGVDANFKAVTPCFTYADNRCSAEVDELRAEIDEDEHFDRTGTRLHTSYLIPRFRWLERTASDVLSKAKRWVSLGEYVHLQLLGEAYAGTSTAAWTGMLDRRTGHWDQESLDQAHISADVLSQIRTPGQAETASSRWPALKGAIWFPSITDGYASNLGAGGTDATTLVASMSTSGAMRVLVDDVPETIPPGLWCCRVDDKRSLLGGALNDVGRAVVWLDDVVRLPDHEELLASLAQEPDELTPTVVPYFTGERSPGYAGAARALLGGISIAATGVHLYRGTLEGIALSYERIGDQLKQVATAVERVVVAGRVSLDIPPLAQMLGDVMATPVRPLTAKRTTLRGTALHALAVVDPGGRRAPAPLGTQLDPVQSHVDYFDRRAVEFERLYAVCQPSVGGRG